jgi:hypothetical protein
MAVVAGSVGVGVSVVSSASAIVEVADDGAGDESGDDEVASSLPHAVRAMRPAATSVSGVRGVTRSQVVTDRAMVPDGENIRSGSFSWAEGPEYSREPSSFWEATTMTYDIRGSLLEVCTCTVQCACCWADERPTGEDCDRVMAWNIEAGAVGDVDVSGITVAMLGLLDGAGVPVKSFLYVPETVTNAQFGALVALWSGALGGPLADLSKMLGAFFGAQRTTIDLSAGGHLAIGSKVTADAAPSNDEHAASLGLGATGTVGAAGDVRGDSDELGISFAVSGQRAVHGEFRFAK